MPRLPIHSTKCLAISSLVLLCFLTLPAQSDGVWNSGRFSFSDELGGFRIQKVTGTGSRNDPYVIHQILDTADAATLVIRARKSDKATRLPNVTLSSFHMSIITVNNSNVPWIGLGFELQEIIDIASTYGDGLSFDQLGRRASDIYSNRFESFEDQFEPGDRLVYTNGHVNNQTSVVTRFIVTDFTPVPVFYLYQDPLVPAS